MTYHIAPSILSADLARLGEDVQSVIDAGADLIHFDVMDQHYVPNLTFGPCLLQALRRFGITAPMDVHLMVDTVDPLITAFAKAGADRIAFHPEASQHVDRSLQLIRDLGVKAGLVLNPATSLSVLDYVWDKLDFVLVMTVNPGFGGQSFMSHLLPKIQALHTEMTRRGRQIDLAVDGGVNTSNLVDLANSGITTFIAGNAIFNTPDYHATLREMRQLLTTATPPSLDRG